LYGELLGYVEFRKLAKLAMRCFMRSNQSIHL